MTNLELKVAKWLKIRYNGINLDVPINQTTTVKNLLEVIHPGFSKQHTIKFVDSWLACVTSNDLVCGNSKNELVHKSFVCFFTKESMMKIWNNQEPVIVEEPVKIADDAIGRFCYQRLHFS